MATTPRSTARPAAKRAPRPAAGKGRGARVGDRATSDPVVGGVPLSELASVNGGGAGPRSKRAAILDTAVARFGGTGYEATKWSTVADEVGIGQTALYHYFESKAHCLLTIMRLELARSHQRFLVAVADAPSSTEAIRAALIAAFDVSKPEVSQLRILMANGDILANPRLSEREESERLKCLALTHVVETAWTDMIDRKLGERPKDARDARMLALAVLGLINSVWRWYRATGKLSIGQVSTLYVDAALRIVE
jgi:TetR/AcrR family transcriptional regulator, cholesterol catabolism regulator